jgi:hypothetical protein
MTRAALATALVFVPIVPAAAHHGGGTFDGSKELSSPAYFFVSFE